MKKNGQLRIIFQELTQRDGISERVEATLEGVQSAKDANVRLDSEGGAEATTPRTRYLAAALSLTLAAASMNGDTDVDHGVAHTGGDTAGRVAGGATGFKLVGMVLGLAVHSRALGYTMVAYGAGMSVYSHFIARGAKSYSRRTRSWKLESGGSSSNSRKQIGLALEPRSNLLFPTTPLSVLSSTIHLWVSFAWVSSAPLGSSAVHAPRGMSHFWS
jgi:hypothetical protein